MQMSLERLCFTGVLALGVHAVVLLGFNMSSQPTVSVSPPLPLLCNGGDAQTKMAAGQLRCTPDDRGTSDSAVRRAPSRKTIQNPPSKKTSPERGLLQHRSSQLREEPDWIRECGPANPAP